MSAINNDNKTNGNSQYCQFQVTLFIANSNSRNCCSEKSKEKRDD
jgi:hypothetical protein